MGSSWDVATVPTRHLRDVIGSGVCYLGCFFNISSTSNRRSYNKKRFESNLLRQLNQISDGKKITDLFFFLVICPRDNYLEFRKCFFCLWRINLFFSTNSNPHIEHLKSFCLECTYFLCRFNSDTNLNLLMQH